MDMDSLHRFAATSRSNYDMVAALHKRRTCEMLSRFSNRPSALLDVMETADAVVSGSAALAMIIPNTFVPADLDIYVPYSNEGLVSDHLTSVLGYQEEERTSRPHPDMVSYPGRIIAHVSLFRNGLVSVHVVSIVGNNAVLPLFQFHSTIVMNFISSHGLYSAYPRLTLARQGLINVAGKLDQAQLVCIEKYTQRGFTLGHRLPNSEYDTHQCGKDDSCPRTLRMLHDYGGAFWPFTSFDIRKQRKNPRYNTETSALWMLRCRQCIDEGPTIGGLVSTLGLVAQ